MGSGFWPWEDFRDMVFCFGARNSTDFDARGGWHWKEFAILATGWLAVFSSRKNFQTVTLGWTTWLHLPGYGVWNVAEVELMHVHSVDMMLTRGLHATGSIVHWKQGRFLSSKESLWNVGLHAFFLIWGFASLRFHLLTPYMHWCWILGVTWETMPNRRTNLILGTWWNW